MAKKYTVDYAPIEKTRKDGVKTTSYKFTTPEGREYLAPAKKQVVTAKGNVIPFEKAQKSERLHKTYVNTLVAGQYANIMGMKQREANMSEEDRAARSEKGRIAGQEGYAKQQATQLAESIADLGGDALEQ